jgi:hypothetical protein
MIARRSYDLNGIFNGINIELDSQEARDFVSGHENQEDLVIELRTVVREALSLVETEFVSG